MAPSESAILTNFLLSPSPLPVVLSLQKFTAFFPKAQRSNPQIAHLYLDLQYVRALETDQVKANIKREVKRGEGQRREVARARRRLDREEMEEVDAKEMLEPPSDHTPKRPHTLTSILPEMEQACTDMEAEIAALESEKKAIMDDLQATVGDLSDLRYGKFSQPLGSENDARSDVLEGLQNLQQACRTAMRNQDEVDDHHTG